MFLGARCSHECEGYGHTETCLPGTHLSQQLHRKESATQIFPKSCAHPLEVIEILRETFPGEPAWNSQIGRDQMETLAPRHVQRREINYPSKTE